VTRTSASASQSFMSLAGFATTVEAGRRLGRGVEVGMNLITRANEAGRPARRAGPSSAACLLLPAAAAKVGA